MDGIIIPIEMMEEEPALTASAELKSLVEVTRTDPLEKLVWTNKKDPDNERNKILNRTKDPHPA